MLAAVKDNGAGNFHDRKVMASLKPSFLNQFLTQSGGDFHDRKVMASLKQENSKYEAEFKSHFHDRKVMASLKPETGSALTASCST